MHKPFPSNMITVKCEFEVNGWDVKLRGKATPPVGDSTEITIYIELKPTLGDDYPAVLRQMKANSRDTDRYDRRVLLFDRFTTEQVTLEQVKAIFKASGFTVLVLDDIVPVTVITPA